jgi:hypothetical protein
MKDIKLDQNILADSSCYFDKSYMLIVYKTTVKDVVNQKDIILGGGHDWGACPSRRREDVIAKPNDAENLLMAHIKCRDLENFIKTKKVLFQIDARENGIYVKLFVATERVDSLREGKYILYKSYQSSYSSFKFAEGSKIPESMATSLEDAVKKLKKAVKKTLA